MLKLEIYTEKRNLKKKKLWIILICSHQHWYCVVGTTRDSKTAELLGDYMCVDC